ncbi:methionine aminopeptidase, type I [bacterium A37T11]|nr:methionine aminopeptidase, type I [bacterium A37T11]
MSRVLLKSADDIEQLRISAQLLSRLLGEIAKEIKPGVQTIKLDRLAYDFINDHGGTPSFLNYHGFPYSLCISVNDQVVHGFPGAYELKDGDIVSVDGGITLNNFISDSAYTFAVGEISPDVQQLLDVTLESLDLGIEQAVVGKRVGDIGFAIQDCVDKYHYGIVKELVGHGVGFHLHEKPEIPNYGRKGTGIKLEEGMVICIEPMINLGKAAIKFWDDGWTVSTKDAKPSAHFEHMVAVNKGKADILTTFSFVEEALNKVIK